MHMKPTPQGLCLMLGISMRLRGCKIHGLPRRMKHKGAVLALLGCSNLRKLVASLRLLPQNGRKHSISPEKDGRREEARKEGGRRGKKYKPERRKGEKRPIEHHAEEYPLCLIEAPFAHHTKWEFKFRALVVGRLSGQETSTTCANSLELFKVKQKPK